MVLKVRNFKSPKSYGFKMGLPQGKIMKTPGINARNREFAKSRGGSIVKQKNKYPIGSPYSKPKEYYTSRPTYKVPRDQIISSKDWQFYIGDLVQVVKGRLCDPNNTKRYLPEQYRQGKVIEMDYSRNLLRVDGIYPFSKYLAATPFLQETTVENFNWIKYDEIALVDPRTNKPCTIEWKQIAKSPTDPKLVFKRVITSPAPQPTTEPSKSVIQIISDLFATTPPPVESICTLGFPQEHFDQSTLDQDNQHKGTKEGATLLKELNLSFDPSTGSDCNPSYTKHTLHY